MRRLHGPWLAIALAAWLAPSPTVAEEVKDPELRPSVAADAAGEHGLPLSPTRKVRFRTTEGTWLSATVSPDGRTVAFDLLGDLYRISIDGGDATRLTDGLAFDSQPAWSPDGRSIAFLSDRSGAENLWVMRADGSGAKQVTDNTQSYEYVSPAWSPDGRALYVSLYRADHNSIELWRQPLDGGKPEELSSGFNALGATASPDGRYVYYAKRSGPVAQDDVKLPLWSVERRDLARGRTDVVVADQGSAMRPVVSPDGTRLAYAVRWKGQTGLRLRDFRSNVDRLLLYPITHDAQESVATRDLLPGYAFTPDGRSIVLTRDGGFVRVDAESGHVQPIPFAAEVDLDLGPQLRQDLREPSGPVHARLIQEPRQSPDGKRLAFSALGRVYVMDLGPRPSAPRRLTRGDGPNEFHPAWSADGREIAYVTWSGIDGGALWIADVRDGRTRRITTDESFYSDVTFGPGSHSLLALRSSAHDRRRTLQEPMWTGRSGGFLRPAELVEVARRGGAVRAIASGPMGGEPLFGADPAIVHLNTGDGLEAIRLDDGRRAVAFAAVGPAYYFLEGPAAVSEIKLSPDGRHALILEATQLYLVDVAAPRKDDKPLDLASTGGHVRRLTVVGADFAAWADGGRTITWAIGSTYYRSSLDAALAQPAKGLAAPAALPRGTQQFAANVEVPRNTPTGAWVLRGATAVTMRGDEVIRDADVLVRDDRIAAIGPRGQVAMPRDVHVIDASGQYVVPGFIDAHVHMGPIRRNVLEPDDWPFRANLAYGVTGTLDPSSLSIDLLAYEDMVDAGLALGPRLYTTGVAMFSFNRVASLDDARNLVRRYVDSYGTRNLKQYRIGPRRTRQWVAMAAAELGAMPTCEGALDMKLGLTQVLDGFSGNEHSFGVYPLYRDVIELMAQSATSSVQTLMISHGGPPAGEDFVERDHPLDDPKIAQLYPPNVREHLFSRQPWVTPRDEAYPHMAADAGRIQRAGGVLGMGSHGNYPGIGFHWEMQAHAAGGMTPLEVLRAATLGSATAIGRAHELGSLEPGKLADFVVLSQDPLADVRNALAIRRVVQGGRVYDPKTLDETWPQSRKAPPLWFQLDETR